MAPDVKRLGRDVLVWLIGIAATLQSGARAIEAFIDDREDLFLLYTIVTFLLMAAAIYIERLKEFLEA